LQKVKQKTFEKIENVRKKSLKESKKNRIFATFKEKI